MDCRMIALPLPDLRPPLHQSLSTGGEASALGRCSATSRLAFSMDHHSWQSFNFPDD